MKKHGGFTLTELLVVMAIILVLAAILLPALSMVKKNQLARNATTQIEYLKLALDGYKADFGDYPPSSVRALGDKADKGSIRNEGNKALVACLATTRENGPYIRSYILSDSNKVRATGVGPLNPAQGGGEEGEGQNTLTGWVFNDTFYREFLDPWGTPYIYLHNRYYGSAAPQVYTIEGKKISGQLTQECDVAAQTDKDDAYYGPYSFQLWSCGPNRINDNGGEDDITSWQSQ